MSQTISSLAAEPTKPIAMIAFEKAMYNQWNRTCEVATALSQYGTKEMDTSMQTSRFAIPSTTGSPTRMYGDELPSEFANCQDAPTFTYAEVDLKWGVAPLRQRYDFLQLKSGFMGDPARFSIDNLQKDVKFDCERMLCGGVGDAVLFNLGGTGTDNGDGTFTYPVQNYGGRTGQTLGRLMRALLLEGTPIQAATAVGAAPGNLAAVKIVSVTSDPGTETITTDGDLADGGATAAGWVVYRARQDASGVQGATDAHYGLPYIVSDWTDYATFQGVTQTEAPNFQAEVIRSPDAPVTIDEAMFNRLLSLCEVAYPADPGDKKGPVMNGFFLLNTWNVNYYAQSLLKDRRYMTPPLRNAGASGYAKKYLAFCDIPIVGAHMAQRDSAYYCIADRLFWRKNGPLWGQFMAIGGQTRFSIPCSPDQEVRWVFCRQLAAHGRAGMGRHDNLDPYMPEAA